MDPVFRESIEGHVHDGFLPGFLSAFISSWVRFLTPGVIELHKVRWKFRLMALSSYAART
jgi:hypothetical protein